LYSAIKSEDTEARDSRGPVPTCVLMLQPDYLFIRTFIGGLKFHTRLCFASLAIENLQQNAGQNRAIMDCCATSLL